MLYVGTNPIGGRRRHVCAVAWVRDDRRRSTFCIEEEGV